MKRSPKHELVTIENDIKVAVVRCNLGGTAQLMCPISLNS